MNDKYKQEVDSIQVSDLFKKELKQNALKNKDPKNTIITIILVTCALLAFIMLPKRNKQESPASPKILDNTFNIDEVFKVDDPYLHILGNMESWKRNYTNVELGYGTIEVKNVENLTKNSLGVLDEKVTTLPVYLNPYIHEYNETNQTFEPIRLAITNKEIKNKLIQYATKLQMDSYEINYNDLLQEFVLSNDEIALKYQKDYPKFIYVEFKEKYFENHPKFNLNTNNDQDAYLVLDDFYQYYKDLFGFSSVQYNVTHFFGSGINYTYEIYDTSQNLIDNLVASSQYCVYLWPDDQGKLTKFSIPINLLEDYYLQDEEIITKEEAIQYFRQNKSCGSSIADETILKNIEIAATELVYRSDDIGCEFILPYYIIYTKQNDQQYVTKGYTSYERTFVPALKKAYQISFDSWNASYDAGSWYYYAIDDKDIENQYNIKNNTMKLKVYKDRYRFKENEPISEYEMDDQLIKEDIAFFLGKVTNQYNVTVNVNTEMKLYEATVDKYTVTLDNNLPEYYCFTVYEDEYGLAKARTIEEAYASLKQFYQRYQVLWGCGDEVKYYVSPVQNNTWNYTILLPGYDGIEGKKVLIWVADDQIKVTVPTGMEDSLDVVVGEYPIISQEQAINYFRHGKFILNDLKNYNTISIADIHLTYLTNHYKCDYRLPYYVISVPCSWDGVVEIEGYQAYKKYYVPALACEY